MTLDDEKTVGEIAAEFAAARVLEEHHIDYSFGGKHPLAEACRVAGARAQDVMEEIERVSVEQGSGSSDWSTAPLWKLVHHILDRHHAWLHRELVSIERMMEDMSDVHGTKRPDSLFPLKRVFTHLRDELEQHMGLEEHVLFPAIMNMGTVGGSGRPVAKPQFGSVRNSVSMLERDHDLAAQYLDEMRDLTYGYDLPENACHKLRELYEELQALQTDMHMHIHLENNVLFPCAARLEREREMMEASAIYLALTEPKVRQLLRDPTKADSGICQRA
ncbi:MAG TPA: DUF542 domain-containing protein [Bryobacteraceae bacterium]|nr:DUF542 domain-containing protein [Bryobacteraceae bacterium]